MEVRHRKGVASRPDPESCVLAREGGIEALTGERAGQPLSRVIKQSGVPTQLAQRKATSTRALSRAPAGPRAV